MVSLSSARNFVPISQGISMKTLVYGELTLMTEVVLTKNTIMPIHHHPYEQTGFMISGRLNLHIDKDVYEIKPGDSWMIPRHIQHYVETIEDSMILEIFAPPREDYRKYFDKESIIGPA
jgi:quercetin dioxygenase-like cupin family protein